MISRFCRDVDEICALLGYYAVLSGSSVPMLWDNLSVLKRQYRTTTQCCVISQKSAELFQYLNFSQEWLTCWRPECLCLKHAVNSCMSDKRCTVVYTIIYVHVQNSTQWMPVMKLTILNTCICAFWFHTHTQKKLFFEVCVSTFSRYVVFTLLKTKCKKSIQLHVLPARKVSSYMCYL